ncbi:hypothetical protein C8R47DRAFT_1297854 [Mycena vitilis]|nr:hypothetical protein C8R47DRAFT_1297854 [Mycena vitilis]
MTILAQRGIRVVRPRPHPLQKAREKRRHRAPALHKKDTRKNAQNTSHRGAIIFGEARVVRLGPREAAPAGRNEGKVGRYAIAHDLARILPIAPSRTLSSDRRRDKFAPGARAPHGTAPADIRVRPPAPGGRKKERKTCTTFLAALRSSISRMVRVEVSVGWVPASDALASTQTVREGKGNDDGDKGGDLPPHKVITSGSHERNEAVGSQGRNDY